MGGVQEVYVGIYVGRKEKKKKKKKNKIK